MRIDKETRNYAAKYIREAGNPQRTEHTKNKKNNPPSSEPKDSLELTEDAIKKAQEQQKKQLDGNASSRNRGGIEPMDISVYKQQLENAKEQGEAMAEFFDDYIKCLKIALRIMSGDRVPPEDHKFLAEKEPDMYSRAMSLKRTKRDPEEHDRLSEDKEDESEDGTSGIDSERPSRSAAQTTASTPPESAGDGSAEVFEVSDL